MNLKGLIDNYIPEELVFEKQRVMFDTLVGLLANPQIDEATKNPIVDNLFGFIAHKDHLGLARQWLEIDKIFQSAENNLPLFDLQKKHKFSILKNIYKNKEIPLAEKQEILERVIGDDKSDIA